MAFTPTVLADSLGYQPNLGPIFELVGREQPGAIDEGLVVQQAVLLAEFLAPVAATDAA